MRRTARAVIIESDKVLLVTAHEAGFYWLPGGTLEDGETMEQALHREIKEELGTTVKTYKPYRSYNNDERQIEVYIVTIDGKPVIDNEITDYVWYSKNSAINVGEQFKKTILADLIADELVR